MGSGLGNIHREREEGGGGELERPRLGVSHRMRAWRRRGARETIPTVSFLPVVPFGDDHEIPSSEFPGCAQYSPKKRRRLRIQRIYHRQTTNWARLFLHSTLLSLLYYVRAHREAPRRPEFDASDRLIPTRRQHVLPCGGITAPCVVSNYPLDHVVPSGDLGWVAYCLAKGESEVLPELKLALSTTVPSQCSQSVVIS